MRAFPRRLTTIALAASLIGAGSQGAGGASSREAVKATCSISKAAFAPVHLSSYRYSPPLKPDDQYAALTTARAGLWAGYAYLTYPHAVALISWRPGQRHATILARFSRGYRNAYAIHLAGITSNRAIVFSLLKGRSRTRFATYAQVHGHLRTLAVHKSWMSVYADTVTPSGTIFGTARSRVGGHDRYQLVRWSSYRATPRVIATVPAGEDNLYVDAAGDAAWDAQDGQARVRLASGAVRTLAWPGIDQVIISNAAGHAIYGETVNGVYRYDLSTVPATGDIPPTASLGRGKGVDNWVTAASSRGDLVTGVRSQVLITARGSVYPLPRSEADGVWGTQGFDASGTFAFTSAHDGRVHFVRCR